jgi:predicted PurR-regulated permease PerM
MNKKEEKLYASLLDIQRIIPLITALFFITFLILAFLTFRAFILSLFLSSIFYILFLPLYHYLNKKLRNKKTLSSLIMVFLIILTIAIPSVFLLITIIQEISFSLEKIRLVIHQFNEKNFSDNPVFIWLIKNLGLSRQDIVSIQTSMMKSVQSFSLGVIKDLRFVFSDIARFIMNFIISIFVLFFFFRSGDEIGKIIYNNFPFQENLKQKIVERMILVFNAVVKGNIIIAIGQGLILGILFWVFDLPTPALYGILGAFSGFIPVAGTNIIWIPAALYMYSQDHITSALVFSILAFSAYIILENVAKPMLLDKKLNLHPMILLLSLLGGLAEFGIKGLILGPFSITIFLTLWQLVKLWNVDHGNIEE